MRILPGKDTVSMARTEAEGGGGRWEDWMGLGDWERGREKKVYFAGGGRGAGSEKIVYKKRFIICPLTD